MVISVLLPPKSLTILYSTTVPSLTPFQKFSGSLAVSPPFLSLSAPLVSPPLPLSPPLSAGHPQRRPAATNATPMNLRIDSPLQKCRAFIPDIAPCVESRCARSGRFLDATSTPTADGRGVDSSA